MASSQLEPIRTGILLLEQETAYYAPQAGTHMTEQQPLNEESSAVQAHLTTMQGVIQRMAENSRSCKVWCITLVSAILVLVAQTGEPKHALIALVPLILFLVLDTYYLALERGFRKSYKTFVEKLHSGELDSSDLYFVDRKRSMPKQFFARLWFFSASMFSFSIWPFYLTLTGMTLFAWRFVIP